MRVAIYIRVSTIKQEGGVETQRQELEGYCQRRGFEIVEVYEDIGESGAKDNRPALEKLMQDARKRHFDAVIVQRLDRLGRSVRHLLHTLDELQSLGIDFISIHQGIDTTTPSGRMILAFLGAISEYARELIKERVRAGLERAKRQGKRLGRKPLKIDENLIESLRNKNKSIREIARIVGCSKSKVLVMLQKRSKSVHIPSINSIQE